MTGPAAIIHNTALRRLLREQHPDVWERHSAAWAAWLALRRARLPDPDTPRVFVVIPVHTIEDVVLYTGVLQLIGTPGLLALLVLVLPNPSSALLARADAMAQGWGSLVTITTIEEWAVAAERLPSSVRIVQFSFPAAFTHFAASSTSIPSWDELAASVEPAGGVTLTPAADAGTISAVEHLPDLDSHLRALVNARSVHPVSHDKATDDGSARQVASRAEAWLRPHSLILGSVSQDDLIAVTTQAAGNEPIVAALVHRGLSDRSATVRVELPPRYATLSERTLEVHQLSGQGTVRVGKAVICTAPSMMEGWMLTAYLNRGGAGNPVVTAFARGAGCRLAYAVDDLALYEDELPTIPVVWGVLRGSDQIVARAESQNLPFYYVDHAYFDRGHGRSYRISLSRYEAGPVRRCPDDRLRNLNLTIEPWRKSGRTIMVCPPTEYFAAAHGCPNWLDETLTRLRTETDRPIVVRSKPAPGEPFVPLKEALADTHAVVTHSSNVAVEAACLGIPVFVAPTSAAAPIGCTDLARIEQPRYPNREGWLAHLAYSQFTLEEFASGLAWSIMRDHEERAYV